MRSSSNQKLPQKAHYTESTCSHQDFCISTSNHQHNTSQSIYPHIQTDNPFNTSQIIKKNKKNVNYPYLIVSCFWADEKGRYFDPKEGTSSQTDISTNIYPKTKQVKF